MAVVVNPASGRGRAARILPTVSGALAKHGFEAEITVTRDADDLRAAVRRARAAEAERVIVCGGDGSIHLAIQELAGGDTALGIVPAGTGDDNARTLGIPLKDTGAAVTRALTGEPTRVDLGRVTTADGEERVFLGVLSSGFDSLVNERANSMSWPSGHARYAIAILGELRTFRPVHYRAVIDERDAVGAAMLVAVGNGASYGGGMRVCPGADPTDGMLDVTWLHGVSRATFLRVFPQVFSGEHVRTRYVSTVRAKAIALDADGQVAYADGERVGPLPVSIDVLPRALPVILGSTAA